MTIARLLLLLPALLLAIRAPAGAQLPAGLWAVVEAHPAFGSPRGDFSGEPVGAGQGLGFSTGASLGRGALGVYGEYKRLLFDCPTCGQLELDDRLADTGWEGGLLLRGPAIRLGVRPWIRGGLLRHQLVFAGQGATTVSQGSSGLGVGAGLRIPAYRFIELAPSATYQSYEATFDFADEGLPTRSTDVSYLIYRLGLAVRF